MRKKLTKKEIKQLAHAIVCQIVGCFDINDFDDNGVDISSEQQQLVLNEIGRIADRYENDYSHIGSVSMIIDAIRAGRN